jgi:hypothetical protein
VWASPEACLVIDNADYNKSFILSLQSNSADGGDLSNSFVTPGLESSSSINQEEIKESSANGGKEEKLTAKEKV